MSEKGGEIDITEKQEELTHRDRYYAMRSYVETVNKELRIDYGGDLTDKNGRKLAGAALVTKMASWYRRELTQTDEKFVNLAETVVTEAEMLRKEAEMSAKEKSEQNKERDEGWWKRNWGKMKKFLQIFRRKERDKEEESGSADKLTKREAIRGLAMVAVAIAGAEAVHRISKGAEEAEKAAKIALLMKDMVEGKPRKTKEEAPVQEPTEMATKVKLETPGPTVVLTEEEVTPEPTKVVTEVVEPKIEATPEPTRVELTDEVATEETVVVKETPEPTVMPETIKKEVKISDIWGKEEADKAEKMSGLIKDEIAKYKIDASITISGSSYRLRVNVPYGQNGERGKQQSILGGGKMKADYYKDRFLEILKSDRYGELVKQIHQRFVEGRDGFICGNWVDKTVGLVDRQEMEKLKNNSALVFSEIRTRDSVEEALTLAAYMAGYVNGIGTDCSGMVYNLGAELMKSKGVNLWNVFGQKLGVGPKEAVSYAGTRNLDKVANPLINPTLREIRPGDMLTFVNEEGRVVHVAMMVEVVGVEGGYEIRCRHASDWVEKMNQRGAGVEFAIKVREGEEDKVITELDEDRWEGSQIKEAFSGDLFQPHDPNLSVKFRRSRGKRTVDQPVLRFEGLI